ncbi:MAG: hypothetical protein JEZ08_03255 [Clostridiales bacterium]|nr:hypothetical protein [Clostridiales bacterium]
MYYKFSKSAKAIIILNVVLCLVIGIMHSYNVHRLNESNEIIYNYMEENNVIKETAIRLLEKDGVELFVGKEFTTYFGVLVSFLSLILLYVYGKHNGFIVGFFAAFFCVFTSLIGGMLLFYIMFSGKSETTQYRQVTSIKNEWEKFIHNKSSNN